MRQSIGGALVLAAFCITAGAAPVGAQVTEPGQAVGQATAPVRVAGGRVAGVVDSVGGIRLFRGIPYAAPPVGALRWQPPQPVVAWKGVRRADRFGPRCAQLPVFGDMVFRSDGVAEDCLYLNVWAPPAAGKQRLPVLVYFFGGGFIAGDGSEYRYDGASLARRGLVTVTVNYRLGVLGLLAHPELTRESAHHASGNYGLLDQAAALAWVRRNIAAFGGDPARVTIAGESAGSISVSAQMASPLSRKLIAGAIGESGGAFHPTIPPAPLPQAESVGVRFASSVGATSLAQLRALPADSLLRAAARTRFPLTIDGWFLPASLEEIFAAGRQAHVPLMVGWNSEEAGWRALLGDQEPTAENWQATLRRLFGERAEEAGRLYPGETREQVLHSATELAGARFIAYSTWKWGELHARTGGRPVYRYLYAHPRPATKEPSTTPPPSGAVHSAEIEYALGNLATNRVYAWTADDQKVSQQMEGYFANFIKAGDPNGSGLPHWPAASEGGPSAGAIMVLDVDPHAERELRRDAYLFLDRVYDAERQASTAAAPRP